MAYEFTPMSEVEVSAEPADTSHVFIEEGGVVKRAPIDAVGGSKGMVVELTADNTTKSDDVLLTCSMNYDTIYETIVAGGTVVFTFDAKLIFDQVDLNMVASVVSSFLDSNGLLGLGAGFVATFMPIEGGQIFVFFPNGSYHGEATT